MKENMLLIQNPAELEGLWIVDAFNSIYSDNASLKGCAIAVLGGESGNPDKVAMVTLRTFIQNGSRAQDDQKYVVGVRFYSMGDMASIDVISLDKAYHKHIAYEHLKRLQWPMLDELMRHSVDEYGETVRAPFAVVGGHLSVSSNDEISFSGASGDYGNSIFLSDSNSIAAYTASACGLDVIEGDKEKGEAFVNDLLQFMLAHKLQPDFYEQFTDHVLDGAAKSTKPFSHQHIGALMTMKAADRVISEGIDMMQAGTEEMHGFSRYFLLTNVARQLREKEEV